MADNKDRKCCSIEKKRLVGQLMACDYCSTSYEEHRECYGQVARESGVQAKKCMM